MQLGRMKEAEKYFQKAYAFNPNYAQTLYALAMVNNIKHDYDAALFFATHAGRNCKPSDPLYNHAFELAYEVSGMAIRKTDPMEMYNEFSRKLAVASGMNIDLIEDETIPTPAKLELAENYKRDKHIIRYKKAKTASQ